MGTASACSGVPAARNAPGFDSSAWASSSVRRDVGGKESPGHTAPPIMCERRIRAALEVLAAAGVSAGPG